MTRRKSDFFPIVRAAKNGMEPREIARRHHVKLRRVYSVLGLARKTDPDVPSFGAGRPRGFARIPFPAPVVSALKAPARARSITPDILAGQIVAAVARNDLVDAVLDDGGEYE